MKKKYFTALAALICTAGIVNAKQQPRNPFKHTATRHTNSPYSKKATESLPQRTLKFRWDDIESDWVNMPDTTYTVYNNNGKVIRETYIRYFDSTRTDVHAFAYTYNSANQLIAQYTLYLLEPTQQWDTASKTLYEYDTHGNQTLHSYYLSEMSGAWELEDRYKTINTYDTNNRLIDLTYQFWENTEFVNKEKEVYSYDASGKVTELLTMQWNDKDSRFDTSGRVVNIVWYKWVTNLEDGLLQSIERQKWNGSTFEQYSRLNMAYDSHDNITDVKDESWVNNNWLIEYWENYALTYNANNALTQKTTQSWNGDNLVNNRKELYDDFVLYNGIEHIANQSTPLSFYPNPFEATATIEIPTYTHSTEMVLVVYDLLGRSVMTQPIDTQKTILEKGNLQQGIYTFHLMENNTVTHTGKFIIK